MADTRRNQAIVLLLGETLLIASSALWNEARPGTPWLSAIYAGFFCMGGYLLAHTKRWLVSYIALALVGVIAGVFQEDSSAWLIVHTLSVTSAQAMLFYAVLSHSFFKPNVPHSDRILAGVAGYLLLGIFWTVQFNLLVGLDPDCLHSAATGQAATRIDTLYFSFVTLTTLGYGDIQPVTPITKVAAVFTSLTGVLYLAVFISALVGGVKKPTP